MNSKPHFLILCGDGINCENETAFAFRLAGAKATIVHINELLRNTHRLAEYQGLALPGGFSFGDELGSGQILALKLKYGLAEAFHDFCTAQKPILGICNGFQALVKLGLLPDPKFGRVATLAPNEKGSFTDEWVTLIHAQKSICHWTRTLPETFELPIRHGEGRLLFAKGQEAILVQQLEIQGQVPLRYQQNVNGSYQQIAALCDSSGLIFGLMPHPEAYVFEAQYHRIQPSPFEKAVGFKIFESIVQYFHS